MLLKMFSLRVFTIYLAWEANTEQLFLMLFWVQCMSQEMLSEDVGSRSGCGLLCLNA